MPGVRERWPAALALVASLLGLTFASLSSQDYIQHLDRQIHDVHCSYVPGLGAGQTADNACRVAMYSPYAALFRDRYWGGVPISLFAVGCFGFFAAFAFYLLLAGKSAPKKALIFLAVFGASPALVSALMATISALKLGHFCKTCVGMYVSSALLAIAGIAAWVTDRVGPALPPAPRAGGGVAPTLVDQADHDGGRPPIPPGPAGDAETTARDPEAWADKWGRPAGGFALVPAWALALGVFTAIPSALYVGALPSVSSYITSCGKLEKPEAPPNTLLHVRMPGAKQPATLFVDPLCPTCKAFHQRLVSEGVFEKLDITLVVFPLDNECNWMLDRPVHPGACAVSKAILCSEHRALSVLEWAYDHQEAILEAAKAGAGVVNVRAMIKDRFAGLDACIDSKETKLRLDRTLRYIVQNRLQVSTPQMFLGETRLCDEDTDMGLAYTIRKLAPGLAEKR